MKKFFLMTLVAGIAMLFASCGKEVDLTASTWRANETVTQQVVVSGITADLEINADCTLNFVDATTGTITSKFSGSVTAMGQNYPVPEGGGTDTFTYTFDGENGVLVSTDPNEPETIPFTYDKKSKTIEIDLYKNYEDIGVELNVPLHFERQ